jgi:hypothetical protein
MNSKFGIGLVGFICGAIVPIVLVMVLKLSASRICSPGRLIANLINLKSTFTIYTPTEMVGLYSAILTILIYATLFTMIFVGFNFLFGSRAQSQ